jgi:hypothetical protein
MKLLVEQLLNRKMDMFDLEKAIADWRKQMTDAGVKNGEVLNELESHLRDDIEEQTRAGLCPQQAFEIAVERIGQGQALKREFAKTGLTKMNLLAKLKRFLLGYKEITPPDLNSLTPLAQQTLEFARAEAPLLNHDFIGTEHVLLGVLKSQSGIAPKVMRRLGLEFEAIRAEIEKVIGPGLPAQRIAANIPYTPRAKRALALAAKEAGDLNEAQVSPEHIFLGLIKEGEGVAAIVLKNLGVDIVRARGEIIKEMNLRKNAG